MRDVKVSAAADASSPVARSALGRNEVAAVLRALVAEIASIDADAISEDATLDGALSLESAQLAQLGVAVEEELDIYVDALEILTLNSFGLIVDYIHQLVNRE